MSLNIFSKKRQKITTAGFLALLFVTFCFNLIVYNSYKEKLQYCDYVKKYYTEETYGLVIGKSSPAKRSIDYGYTVHFWDEKDQIHTSSAKSAVQKNLRDTVNIRYIPGHPEQIIIKTDKELRRNAEAQRESFYSALINTLVIIVMIFFCTVAGVFDYENDLPHIRDKVIEIANKLKWFFFNLLH